MRWSTCSVAIASVFLLGCESPGLSRQQRAVEEETVQNRVTDWTNALNNRAVEDLTGLYLNSPDLSVLWIEGITARGFEEFDQMIKDFFEHSSFMNFAVQSPDVDVLTATVAVVTFRHSVDIQWLDNQRDLWGGHGTLVFIKDPVDERWRIRRQHVSLNPPR